MYYCDSSDGSCSHKSDTALSNTRGRVSRPVRLQRFGTGNPSPTPFSPSLRPAPLTTSRFLYGLLNFNNHHLFLSIKVLSTGLRRAARRVITKCYSPYGEFYCCAVLFCLRPSFIRAAHELSGGSRSRTIAVAICAPTIRLQHGNITASEGEPSTIIHYITKNLRCTGTLPGVSEVCL